MDAGTAHAYETGIVEAYPEVRLQPVLVFLGVWWIVVRG
jgi:hypothetical protein